MTTSEKELRIMIQKIMGERERNLMSERMKKSWVKRKEALKDKGEN